MTDLEKAARLALNRLTAAQEWIDDAVRGGHRHHTEIESAGDLWPETVALRAALAQQAKPVALTVAQQLRQLTDKFADEWNVTDIETLSMAAYILEQAEPVVDPSVESMLQAGRFCDANCTALDHHADCVIGNPSY